MLFLQIVNVGHYVAWKKKDTEWCFLMNKVTVEF